MFEEKWVKYLKLLCLQLSFNEFACMNAWNLIGLLAMLACNSMKIMMQYLYT